jgi:outer membrane murein-binding lipoprotein Lpp
VLVGTDQRVRVTDFGLARSLMDQVEELVRDHPQRPDLEALRVTLTATGTVLGTPRYMAPEQLRGSMADPRSDQFSYCVALYEALYGQHPIPGDSVIEMVQHGVEPQPPPTDTKVPPTIGKAISRGLSPDPNKRFPSMAALLVELTPPPVHKSRRTWAAVVAGVALAGGGAAAATLMRGEDTSRVEELEKKITVLIEERNRLQEEIEAAKRSAGQGIAKIKELQKEIAEKDREIQELAEELKLSAVPPPDAAPRPPPPPRIDAGPPPPRGLDDVAFNRAILPIQGQIESCMGEWIERKPDREGLLVVSVNVGPDGTVRGTTTRGLTEGFTPECVSGAIKQAVFPSATAMTSGEVRVVIVPGQPVQITTRTTGARDPGSIIDLEP